MRTFGTLLVVASVLVPARAEEAPVRFRDAIVPILQQRCLACHNASKAGGDVRLDTFARLTQKTDAGSSVIPGKAADSPLYQVLVTDEASKRMPRKAAPLPAAEIEAIRRWIDEGATYDGNPGEDLATIVSLRKHPEPPAVYRATVPIYALALSPDGKEVATGGYHEALIWEAATGKLLRRIPNVGQQTQGLAWSPDGSLLAVASGSPGEYGELKAFDPHTGQLVRAFDTSGDILLTTTFSPDQQFLAVAGADRSVRIFHTATGKETSRIKQNADWVTALSFNREATSLAVGSRDQMVKVYEPKTAQLQAAYPGHHARVHAVAFDQEGALLCTAGDDQKLHLWIPKAVAEADGTAAQMEERFRKAPPVVTVPVAGKSVLGLVVAKGQVFAASADGNVRQYELTSRKPVREYAAGSDWINAVAVDAAGQRLAAGAFDGTVSIFDTASGERIARFTAAPGR